MKTLLIAIISASCGAKAFGDCAIIEEDSARLACYDKGEITETVKEEAGFVGDWVEKSRVNPVDDSKTVYILTESETVNRWGNSVTLVARCQSNKTEVYISWGEYLGSDESQVLTRIGKNKATTTSWFISNNSKSSFRRKPIAFLKQLLGEDKMFAQVTPYGENSMNVTFNIAGLDEAIKPLRETCHW